MQQEEQVRAQQEEQVRAQQEEEVRVQERERWQASQAAVRLLSFNLAIEATKHQLIAETVLGKVRAAHRSLCGYVEYGEIGQEDRLSATGAEGDGALGRTLSRLLLEMEAYSEAVREDQQALRGQMDALTAANEGLTRSQAVSQAAMADLRVQLKDSLHAADAALNAEIAALKAANLTRQQEYDAEYKKWLDKESEYITAVKNAEGELARSQEELRAQFDISQRQLEESFRSSNEALNAEIAALQSALTKSREEIVANNKELLDKENIFSVAKDEWTRSQEELRAEISALTASNALLTAEVDSLKESIQTNQHDYDAKYKEFLAMETDLKSAHAEVESLKIQLQESYSSADKALNAEITALNESILKQQEDSKAKIKEWLEKESALQSKINQLESARKELVDVLAVRDSDLRDKTNFIDAMKNKWHATMQAYKTDMDGLRGQVSQLEKERESLLGQAEEKKALAVRCEELIMKNQTVEKATEN